MRIVRKLHNGRDVGFAGPEACKCCGKLEPSRFVFCALVPRPNRREGQGSHIETRPWVWACTEESGLKQLRDRGYFIDPRRALSSASFQNGAGMGS